MIRPLRRTVIANEGNNSNVEPKNQTNNSAQQEELKNESSPAPKIIRRQIPIKSQPAVNPQDVKSAAPIERKPRILSPQPKKNDESVESNIEIKESSNVKTQPVEENKNLNKDVPKRLVRPARVLTNSPTSENTDKQSSTVKSEEPLNKSEEPLNKSEEPLNKNEEPLNKNEEQRIKSEGMRVQPRIVKTEEETPRMSSSGGLRNPNKISEPTDVSERNENDEQKKLKVPVRKVQQKPVNKTNDDMSVEENEIFTRYFSEINGISPKIKYGVNYTNESLENFPDIQDSEKLKSFFKEGIKNPNFKTLIEVGADIGIFSLFFASIPDDKKAFRNIISFETDPNKFKMLEHNISAYGLNDKIKAMNVDFETQSLEDLGSILFLNGFVNNGYYTKKFGEILNKYSNKFGAIIIFTRQSEAKKNFSEYKSMGLRGFSLVDKKDYVIYFYINNIAKDVVQKEVITTNQDKLELTRSFNESFKNQLEWYDYCNSIVPSNRETFGSTAWFSNMLTSQWLEDFQYYIKSLLSYVVKDEKILKDMISESNMLIWVKAVSHVTINTNMNYEKLEKIGDALLKNIFPYFLNKKNPNFTEHEITSFGSYYMSKRKQGLFAKQMKLHEWLLCEYQDPNYEKIHEDLFESFFGALETVGDTIAPCYGTICGRNYMIAMFKNEAFDYDIAKPPKTELQQRGTALGFDVKDKDGGVKMKSQEFDEQILHTIFFQDAAKVNSILTVEGINIESIRVKNIQYQPNCIYLSQTLVDVDNENGAVEAWGEALRHVEKFGYTESNVNNIKLKRLLSKQNQRVQNSLIVKYKSAGYDYVKFLHPQSSKKHNSSKIAILVGTKPNSKFEYKLSIGSGYTVDEAENKAILNYINS